MTMMHFNFSFLRFWHTLRHCWQTQVQYPYLTMLGLLIPFYLSLSTYYEHATWICFSIVFYVCGWLHAGTSFQNLDNPTKGRQFLALPASVFEKWLAKWVLSALIFPMIMIGFCAFALQVFNYFAAPLITVRHPIMGGKPIYFKSTLFYFYLLHSMWFAAGLFWKRSSLLKSVSILALIFMAYLFSCMITPVDSPVKNDYLLYNLINLPFEEPESPHLLTQQTLYWVLGFYVPNLLFLAASFYLFKQKEV